MKKIFLKLLSFIFMSNISFICMADSMPVPVAVSVTVSGNNETRTVFFREMDHPEAHLKVPSGMRYAALVTVNKNHYVSIQSEQSTLVAITPTDTVASATRRVYLKGGGSGSMTWGGTNPNRLCIGIVFLASNNGLLPPSQTYIPAGSCAGMPPSTTYCNFDSNNLDINHGVITNSNYISSLAQSSGSITCSNGDATVAIRLSEEVVQLTSGLESKLTVDVPNAVAGAYPIFTLPSGKSTFVVNSELTGTAEAGDYSKNAVMFIEYQ